MTDAKRKHGTAIEWTQRPGTRGETWNPIRARNRETGKMGWHCTHVSEACRFCYAERINVKPGATGGTGLAYKPGNLDLIEILLPDHALLKPLHWRDPRTIFACSMSDIAGEFVTDDMLDRIFAVMAVSPQHTYIVLTKRTERMKDYLSADIEDRIDDICHTLPDALNETWHYPSRWPLKNVWIGTSVEDQETADTRIPQLLATPAAVRFLSCEPLLGPVDLQCIDGGIRSLNGNGANIDWVIAGGESGPKARPCKVEWIVDLMGQCRAAGVAVFVKQLGAQPFWIEERATLITDKKGGDWNEWPPEVRVREFPVSAKPIEAEELRA